jgi:TolA-binding protein
MVTVLSSYHTAGATEAMTEDAEQLDFAHGLFQRGLYDMAIIEYNNMIASFPESTRLEEAHFGIAESLFFSKSYTEAITHYKQHLEEFPKGDKAAVSKLRIGQSLFLLDDYDTALEYFTDIKKKDLPDNLVQILYLYTGKTYKAKDDRFNAFKYFNKVRDVAKKGAYTAAAFFEAGDMLANHAMYQQAFGYYAQAYDSATTGDMKSLALYKQAEMHFSSKKYAAAAEIFKRVVQEHAGHDIAKEALANRLLSLFNIDEHEEVTTAYQEHKDLLEKNSKFFNSYYAVASAYAALANHDKSLVLLDTILGFSALKPEDRHKTLLKKAGVLLDAKRFGEVVAVVDAQLTDASQDIDRIAFLEAEAHYELKDFDAAFVSYKRIIDEVPDSIFADEALYGMGFAQYAAGNHQKAIEIFLTYFQKGKDEAKRRQALYRVLVMETKLGLTEAAIEHCQTFLATFKETHLAENVLFQLGSLHSKAKDFPKATSVFKQFIDEFKESQRLPEAHFLLAYNAQLSNNMDEAVAYYQEVPPEKKELFYPSLKNTAFIHLQRDNDAAAAETLNRIITEFEDNDLRIDIYIWLARHYVDTKAFDDALHILATAESKKKKEVRGKREEMAYLKAEAYRNTDEYKKAIQHYDSVLSFGEESIYAAASHIGKGLCLVALEDYANAGSEFETAIREYPEDNTITMRARFELANIKQHAGELNEACRFYMLVAVLYQDEHYCPEALYRAGELFEKLEKQNEAQKAYEEIIDRYKKSPRFKNAKAKLRGAGE